MSELPDSLARATTEHLLKGRHPAWLSFASGTSALLSATGDLDHYGLAALRNSTPQGDLPPWLLAQLPLHDERLSLPICEIDGDRAVELLGWSAEDHDMLLVLDATRSWRRQQAMQQAANDQLRRPEAPGVLLELTEMFGVLVARVHEDHLEAIGRIPAWVSEFVENRAYFQADRLGPFVETFLSEAREFFANAKPGRLLRSGIFTDIVLGEDAAFEAVAVLLPGGDRILLVEPEGTRFEEQARLIQRAREGSLKHQRLLSEIEKKEVLLHCIVHDLKGPLTVLASTLTLLASGSLGPDETARLLDVGRRQARRQERMILDILEVFGSELDTSSATDPVGEKTRLETLLLETSEEFRPAFEQRNASLTVDLEPKDAIAFVPGDGDRLRRVLANLFENALRHTPRAHGVRARLSMKPEEVIVTVENDGAPIPIAQRGTLFERFSRDPHSGGAAGLGLFYCRITVERYGGRIWLDESFANGARFHFALPLRSSP